MQDDDDQPTSFDDIAYEPVVNIVHSCLPITEENEEELEQLRRDAADEEEAEQEEQARNHLLKINDGSIPTVTLHDDDDRADILENDDDQIVESEAQILIMNTSSNFDPNQDIEKRLSTIYESPSPQPRTEEDDDDDNEEEVDDNIVVVDEDIYDEAYDRLIVYDIANVEKVSRTKRKMLIEQTKTFTRRTSSSSRRLSVRNLPQLNPRRYRTDRPFSIELVSVHATPMPRSSRVRRSPVLSPPRDCAAHRPWSTPKSSRRLRTLRPTTPPPPPPPRR